MKHLPKHLRQRWRYLGVGIEAWPDADLDRGAFQRELRSAAGNLLGDPGSAAVDLTVYDFGFESGVGDAVVRVRRGEAERGRAVVASVTAVDDQPIRTRVRGVSGTVRGCEERYLRRPLEPLEHEARAFADTECPAAVRGNRVDIRVDEGFVGAMESEFE